MVDSSQVDSSRSNNLHSVKKLRLCTTGEQNNTYNIQHVQGCRCSTMEYNFSLLVAILNIGVVHTWLK